jgi:CubicO group peptidase (beta-lactamase class C family)
MSRIDELLQEAVENQEMAGINLLVLKDGKEALYSQAGYADVENKKPYDRDTINRMYSMSKPVTGAAAMILMERGLLSINQSVSDFIPEFREISVWENGKKVPAKRPVYIRDLLSMTSGLVYGGCDEPAGIEVQKVFDEADARLYGDHPFTTRELAGRFADCGLAYQPGREWRYGTSADVMGAVVEQVTGMRYGEFLQQEIFEPLGMTDTGFYVPVQKQNRLAKAYECTENGVVECRTNNLDIMYTQEKPPAFESGGAGLVSTLDDYAKFAGMLLNEGRYGDKQILSPETVSYFTAGKLLPWQKEYMWSTWDSLAGYNYGNLMRVMEDPGMAYFQTWKGEYGWDGWLGTYFCNSPQNKVTILMGMQLKDAGAFPITQKMRNVLAHEEVLK